MSNSKHTPGPWSLDRRLSDGTFAIGTENWITCRVEHESDVALVSAAPEMLEALRDVAAIFSAVRTTGSDLISARALNQVRDLIAKATGESKNKNT